MECMHVSTKWKSTTTSGRNIGRLHNINLRRTGIRSVPATEECWASPHCKQPVNVNLVAVALRKSARREKVFLPSATVTEIFEVSSVATGG